MPGQIWHMARAQLAQANLFFICVADYGTPWGTWNQMIRGSNTESLLAGVAPWHLE